MDTLKSCRLCPRECGIDRNTTSGFCKAGAKVKIARAALHHWEEPPISGKRGSGTVFFSGCNLKCVYCQNVDISHKVFGKEVTAERLGEIFLELQALGAHNINLVSPTPYIPQICDAIDSIKDKIKIPFVCNTGGYEKVETIRALKGYIDIFLTDIKYFSPELSKKYSGVSDYFEYALATAAEMIDIAGKPVMDDAGIMKSGVIIRHLVLPGCRKDSLSVIDALAENFDKSDFILSLMSQYTPNDYLQNFPEINRKVTSFEYNTIVDAALNYGFDNAYIQNKSSAQKEYTPPFDLSGV